MNCCPLRGRAPSPFPLWTLAGVPLHACPGAETDAFRQRALMLRRLKLPPETQADIEALLLVEEVVDRADS